MVKRATLVTKVLRSMSMPSSEVMRTAATKPARHWFTTTPALPAPTTTSSIFIVPHHPPSPLIARPVNTHSEFFRRFDALEKGRRSREGSTLSKRVDDVEKGRCSQERSMFSRRVEALEKGRHSQEGSTLSRRVDALKKGQNLGIPDWAPQSLARTPITPLTQPHTLRTTASAPAPPLLFKVAPLLYREYF